MTRSFFSFSGYAFWGIALILGVAQLSGIYRWAGPFLSRPRHELWGASEHLEPLLPKRARWLCTALTLVPSILLLAGALAVPIGGLLTIVSGRAEVSVDLGLLAWELLAVLAASCLIEQAWVAYLRAHHPLALPEKERAPRAHRTELRARRPATVSLPRAFPRRRIEAARQLICRQGAQRLAEAKSAQQQQQACTDLTEHLQLCPREINIARLIAAGDFNRLGEILSKAAAPPRHPAKLPEPHLTHHPRMSGQGTLAELVTALCAATGALAETVEEAARRWLYLQISLRTGIAVRELREAVASSKALEDAARARELHERWVCQALALAMLEAHQGRSSLRGAFKRALIYHLKLSPKQLNGMSARKAQLIFRAVQSELRNRGLPGDDHPALNALIERLRQRAFEKEQEQQQHAEHKTTS